MRKTMSGLLALFAGVAVMGTASLPVAAAPVAKHGISVQSDVIQARHRVNHHRPNLRRHHIWRGPVIIHRFNGGSCSVLKRRAVSTGSRYWWRRYNECRFG